MLKISYNSDEKEPRYGVLWTIETFIYIFWVTCVWGIPLTSAHAQKFKIEIYKTLTFTLNFSILLRISEDHLLFLLQFFQNVIKK